jgi:hypothetical protein
MEKIALLAKQLKSRRRIVSHKSFIKNPFLTPQHRDTQETLAVLERLDLDTEKPTEEELARKFGYEDSYMKGKVNWWQHLKPKLWSLMDEPYSSNAAKVKNDSSLLFLTLQVIQIWAKCVSSVTKVFLFLHSRSR